jgi:predicted nucleic acid-binding protein
VTALIDTSVLVAAMVASEAYHRECRALVAQGECGMYGHGIAETFSTLTGGRRTFRLAASTVSELLGSHFIPRLAITTLTPAEVLRALGEAESRGVRGGGVFDYLHLVAARKAKALRFYTLNMSNFQACHRVGDPEIVHP